MDLKDEFTDMALDGVSGAPLSIARKCLKGSKSKTKDSYASSSFRNNISAKDSQIEKLKEENKKLRDEDSKPIVMTRADIDKIYCDMAKTKKS